MIKATIEGSQVRLEYEGNIHYRPLLLKGGLYFLLSESFNEAVQLANTFGTACDGTQVRLPSEACPCLVQR